MKKLISSTISFLTSAAILAFASFGATFGANTEQYVGAALEGEELLLGDAADMELSFTGAPKALSYSGSDAYNYGDTLDENNRAVYDKIRTLIKPTTSSITIPLPNMVTVKLHSLPGSEDFSEEDMEVYQEAIFGSCKPGIDAALFDYPELYWIEPFLMSINLGRDTTSSTNYRTGIITLKIRSLVINPAYLEGFVSLDEATTYGRRLDEALEKIPVTGNDRYEQLKSVHDYIAGFTFYDTGARFSNSPIGALVEPGVVCEGYAEAFKLICDRLSIPCVLVFGNMNTEDNTGHMWNYVQMEDGIWYAMDVTWDDTDGSNGKDVKYDYFLRGSRRFNTNHTAESNYMITQFTY
ncbi:MAG: hypothetical protein IKH78_00060, partial [Ruminococcus sp.]|nr:hypothetical protein [Ruminococcus sp.]